MADETSTRATRLRPARTEGERQVAYAYVLLALVGAALAFLIAIRIGRSAFIERGANPYDLWLLVAGACGTALALHGNARWFGHPGLVGLKRALAGMAIITVVAPIVAGTLILPLYGTMFGPFALAVTFAGSPFVALVWFATLAGVHTLFFNLRAERETIFSARRR